MGRPERRRAVLAGLALVLGLVLLCAAGRAVSEQRREDKNRMRQTHAVNLLRLETRERLVSWRQAHPGQGDPLLEELGVRAGDRLDAAGRFAVQAAQERPGSRDVTVRLYRPGSAGPPVLEQTMAWEVWAGPDFEFTLP